MKALPRIKEIKEFIKAHESFTIISHVSPDGDTLGSAFALSLGLKKLGKKTQVVCQDEPSKNLLSVVPGINELKKPGEAEIYDAVIAVDCADERRTGTAYELIEKAKYTLKIDHHAVGTDYAQINSVDAEAAAVGEMIYLLLKELEVTLDEQIGTCIYTAIMTDTGNFSYSNTSEFTFRIAAQLKALGVDTYNVNRLIYRNVAITKMRFTSYVLSKVKLLANGQFAYSTVTLDEMKKIGAENESVEGIIDNIRDIDTVELAIFIYQKGEKQFRISLRSKIWVNVSDIAANFGGGGHMRAAGCTVEFNTIEEAEKAVLRVVEKVFDGEF
ncbi:MAG: bifunctional oligoribonuclease/PAP phosphatase NrnA [Clostridia bacterium]|nr:bifunctional oligoribonuclease/PAP phosphatase NrnA [Clostridia bacterium]